MKTKKFLLQEQDIPTAWYNIVADMKNKPLPPPFIRLPNNLLPPKIFILYLQKSWLNRK